MFEETVNRPSRWRTFWPKVDDLDGAKEAIRLSSWIVFAMAVFELVLGGVMTIFGSPLAGATRVGNAVVWWGIGEGIRRRWRSAAILALAIQGIWIASLVWEVRLPTLPSLVLLVGVINAVRGIYAFRRLTIAAPPPKAQVV